MAEEEDGLLRGGRGSPDSDNEVLLVGVGAEQVNVVGRKAGIEETRALTGMYGRMRSDTTRHQLEAHATDRS